YRSRQHSALALQRSAGALTRLEASEIHRTCRGRVDDAAQRRRLLTGTRRRAVGDVEVTRKTACANGGTPHPTLAAVAQRVVPERALDLLPRSALQEMPAQGKQLRVPVSVGDV